MSSLPRSLDGPSLSAGMASESSRLIGGLGAFVAQLRSWGRRQRAIAELERLDDRMLQDIGIRRSDIHSLVLDSQRGARRGG